MILLVLKIMNLLTTRHIHKQGPSRGTPNEKKYVKTSENRKTDRLLDGKGISYCNEKG